MRTRFICLAAIAAILAAAPAAAQEYQPGIYDARDIAGWSYHQAMSIAFGTPVWFPDRQTNPLDGANCNLVTTPAMGTPAEYAQSYATMTPERLMGVMEQLGAPVREVLWVRPDTVEGKHPALRSEYLSEASGIVLQQVAIEVAGPSNVVAVTCTARRDQFESRRGEFDHFNEHVHLFAP